MKTKAVVFTGPKQATVTEVEIPDPAPGEVIVEASVTLMSMGTELICYRAESDPGSHWHGWATHPFYPGYSSVGRVLKVGDGVEELFEGDRVFHTAGHRQYYNVRADHGTLVTIPDAVEDDDAAWCKLATIVQTGVRQAEHAMGDTAVIIGLGPLGQLMTQYLRLLGLREIIVIDMLQARLDAALKHGATAAFCGRSDDAEAFVREHTDDELADVVYDVTGFPAVFPTALKLARRFGTVVLQGDCPHPSQQHLTHDVLTRQLRVFGTHNENLPPEHARWTFKRQAELYMTYVERGQMRMRDLVSHRYAPEQAQETYSTLLESRGDTIGALFEWKNA